MEPLTVAASVMIDLVRQLEAEGIAPAVLCQQAAVDSAFLARPHDRLGLWDSQRIWDTAVALSGDSLLGLHLSERYREGALNILGYVLLNCRDVSATLDCLRRYMALINDGLTVRTEAAGRGLAVVLEPVNVPDNPLPTHGRHVFETLAGGIVLTLRRLTGRACVPIEVSFRHAAGGPVSEYARVFGTLVRFDAPYHRIILRGDDAAAPLHSADATLLPVLEAHAQARLALIEGGGGTSRRVRQVIAGRLTGSVPDVDAIGSALAMSGRALQRALKEEGTSFQALLDDVRRAVAERELRVPGVTAAEVALLLGYSETSAFTRAFRRWTGMTPSSWAAGARPAEPD